MNNEIKIKVLLAAATGATAYASWYSHLAEKDSYYLSDASAHHQRAQTLIRSAAEIAEFTPDEMAMLQVKP